MSAPRRLNRWALTALAAASDHTADAELARDAGIAPSTLADAKSGRRDVSEPLVDRLAEALRVDPRALLCDPYARRSDRKEVADDEQG